MRKIVSGFFIAGCLLLGPHAHAEMSDRAKTDDFSFLQEWVGKAPTYVLPGNPSGELPHGSIWDVPAIKASLEKTLGKERFEAMISGWGTFVPVTWPVEKVGDGVGFFACKPHACSAYMAGVFISDKDGVAQVCWMDTDPADVNVTTELWLSPSGSKKLPDGACLGEHSLQRMFEQWGKRNPRNAPGVN